MLSASFTPSPALQHFARSYHIRHFVFQGHSKSIKPYPPRPEQSIVFYPRQREIVEYPGENKMLVRPNAMIMNQYTVRTNRHTTNDFLVIIVELQPGILYRLCGLPLHHVINTDIEAEAVVSREMSLASERLNSTEDYREMITIIETLLLQLTSRLRYCEHAVDKVAKFILTQNCNPSIDWLASHACLSPRQLERKFKERMGVGPKTFTRLTRMHETYKFKSTAPQTDWLDIALRFGYHDYQHLSKDYHEFGGCSPTELMWEQKHAPENIFGLAETFATKT